MQIKALLSPKALAQELAQLARQLAAAVAQYTQSGGSDAADAAAGNAVLASAQAAPSAPLTTQAASSVPTDTTQPLAQQPTATDVTAETTTPATQVVTKTENDPGFAQAVQGLSDQMKALLAENRIRLKNQHITADNDSQSTQNALETVDQLIPRI